MLQKRHKPHSGFFGCCQDYSECCLSLFRFDTYTFKKESDRLVQYLNSVPNGMILSVAVNDEGSRNLDDMARKAMTKLGSKHFLHLGFRYLPPPPLLQAPDHGSLPLPEEEEQAHSPSARDTLRFVPHGKLVFLTHTFQSEKAKGLCHVEPIHPVSQPLTDVSRALQ